MWSRRGVQMAQSTSPPKLSRSTLHRDDTATGGEPRAQLAFDMSIIRKSRSVSELSADPQRETVGECAEAVPHRRAEDETPRDRRLGASWLSRRSGRGIALLWLAWPALLACVVAVGVLLSTVINHGAQEVPLAFTMAARRGLVLTVLIPPLCLTAIWYRMRGRRGGDRAAMRDSRRVGASDSP